MSEIKNNIINIYDDAPHPNEECQNLKTEWITYCDNLNRKNNSALQNYERCSFLFSKYYECFFADIRKNKHSK